MFDTSWHTLSKGIKRGQFEPRDASLMFDFGSAFFMSPEEFLSVLRHESQHSLMTHTTEYGLATIASIECFCSSFSISDADKEKINDLFVDSQIVVQEGFATLAQIKMYAKLKSSKPDALRWAETFPEKYKSWLEYVKFSINLSRKYQNLFDGKVIALSMNTGLIDFIPKQDLLNNLDGLASYLYKDDTNPNQRMYRITGFLKSLNQYDLLHILEEPLELIAEKVNMPFYSTPTTEEILNFIKYCFKVVKVDMPERFLEIKWPAPPGIAQNCFDLDNIITANLNFNLDDKLTYNLADEDAFKHQSSEFHSIFIMNTNQFSSSQIETLKKKVNQENIHFALIGLTNSPQKYNTFLSQENTEKFLAEIDPSTTLMLRDYDFCIEDNKVYGLFLKQHPNVILYNKPKAMKVTLERIFASRPESKIKYLMLCATEKHVLYTLLLMEEGVNAFHIVNIIGRDKVNEYETIIAKFKYHELLNKDDLISNKVHINNAFCYWMNMSSDFDWVNMICESNANLQT